jgi:hypothetical protein
VATLLAHQGEYGVVTTLSRQRGVSRQTPYRWAAPARAAIEALVTPPSPAAPPRVDPPLARAILTLVTEAHASYRGVRLCLRELRGRAVSLATIVAVGQAAGARARAVLTELVPVQPVALALDEVFGAGHQAGYLRAVDARSGVARATTGPAGPDGTSWAALWRALYERGGRWPVAVHDGGKAAASGSAAVAPAARLQRDLWHVLHRRGQTQARLVRQIAAAEAAWERAERYEAALAAGQRPRQRPPARSASAGAAAAGAAAADAAAADAATTPASGVAYLTGEVRRLLGVVVVEHGRQRDPASRRADVAAAPALLAERAAPAPAAVQDEVRGRHRHLAEALPGLLVCAETLEAVERGIVAHLGAAAADLVAWAWERRTILGDGEALLAHLPADWRSAARALLAAWDGAVRASSAAEGWHADPRPHLAVHRTLSPALLALLAVRRNHRIVPRGQHAGTSPLQRAGWPEAPTDWLGLGLAPAPAPASAEFLGQEVLAA